MKEVNRFKLGEEEHTVVELAAMQLQELQRAQAEVSNKVLKVVAKLLGLEPDLQHHVLKQIGDDFFLVIQEEDDDVPPPPPQEAPSRDLPKLDM